MLLELRVGSVVRASIGPRLHVVIRRLRFSDYAPYSFLAYRRAHAPLGAATEVTHGVDVVVTENHVNRTAPSGCVARLVRPIIFVYSRAALRYFLGIL